MLNESNENLGMNITLGSDKQASVDRLAIQLDC